MPLRSPVDGSWTVWPELSPERMDGRAIFLRRVFEAAEKIRIHVQNGSFAPCQCELRIGDSRVSIKCAVEAREQTREQTTEGPPSYGLLAQLFVPDPDAVFACAIRAGARAVMPSGDAALGRSRGTVIDPFGNAWSIAKLEDESSAA